VAHRIRLARPPRDRKRVRDLARDLSVDSAEVLEYLRSTGEYVRSHLSYVEVPVISAVRERFAPAAPRIAPSPTEVELAPIASQAAGLGVPRRRRARENNPYKGVLRRFTEDDPVDVSPLGWHPAAHQSATPVDGPGDYTAAGAVEPSETMRHLEWAVRGLSEVERDVWLAHGLMERHASVAADCRDAGFQPADLARNVAGFSVVYRVTHGEPAAGVARLLRGDGDIGVA
jgi:hypothetical protein